MSTATGTANLAAHTVDNTTKDCVFVLTHFHMGIGRMRQIRMKALSPDEAAAVAAQAVETPETATALNNVLVTNADKSKLRHQKQLIDSPELEEIRSQDGKLKRFLDTRTCRYSESMGFLPKAFLAELDKVMLAYQHIRRPKLVADFMAKYREMEENDFASLREALGEHFNRQDYPPVDEVEAGFSFHFSYKPVGTVAGLEGISDVIIAREIEKEASARMQALNEWKEAMRLAGLGMVEALFDVLKPQADGKRRKLYDSTVEKLHDFLETFNTRDLANDVEYQKHIDTLKKLMSGVSVERLRESETLKDRVAAQLDVVRKEIGALVSVSGRKFR